MQIIKLSSPSLNKDWSMKFMDYRHYDKLFTETDGDVSIYKPDGSPLAVVLRSALSEENIAQAWAVIKKINSKTSNRSTASGITAVKKKKKDGSLSQVSAVPKGWEVVSAIVGFFERTIRMPYAHACSWNQSNPIAFSKLFPMLRECSCLFKTHVPNRFEVQKKYVDSTHPDWIIPGTVYTTVTVNKNFRTAAHLDVGDLATGFSNMIVIREGLYQGGHLVLPNWKIAFALNTRDIIMFDAHEWHGNTQIVPISKGAMRCSLVLYYREKMVLCQSAEQELRSAKKRKLGDPLFEQMP